MSTKTRSSIATLIIAIGMILAIAGAAYAQAVNH